MANVARGGVAWHFCSVVSELFCLNNATTRLTVVVVPIYIAVGESPYI